MKIDVVWGGAEGETPLSSFDKALSKANMHNYNLIKVSSIIPPNSEIKKSGVLEKNCPIGELVRAIISRNTSTNPREKTVAGLGWSIAEEGGIIMEAKGKEKEECEEELLRSLEDSMKIRDWNWHTKFETKIIEQTVKKNATALVMAVLPSDKKMGEKIE